MKTFIATLALILICTAVRAHSASDAYLTMSVELKSTARVIHAQWDIALRDLDFILRLDDDGDGQVTWGELKAHQAAIEKYAFAHLAFSAPDNPCALKPIRQLVDRHADGAYAALLFDVTCQRPTRRLSMKYSLFFAVDPSHRGIFVMHAGDNTATAVLSPENADVTVSLE
jgi:hypothetical protein